MTDYRVYDSVLRIKKNPNANNTNSDVNDLFSGLPEDIREKLKATLNETIKYQPRVGIMGKSGAGKSSLANGLVGKHVFKVGHAGGCTRTLQEETIEIGGRKITFVDLPGISENPERHQEYLTMYSNELPKLDVILWVIKIDDRANKDDQEFYQWLIQRYAKERVIFVLTQADKTNPTREWNHSEMQPSLRQLTNIDENLKRFSKDFNMSHRNLVAVAIHYDEDENKFYRYKFDTLVNLIVENLPAKAKSSFYSQMDKENKTEEAKQIAKEGFGDWLSTTIDTIIDISPLPSIMKEPVKKVKDTIIGSVKNLWDKWFG